MVLRPRRRPSLSSFQRLAIATTLLTYLLIAVGGLVRASGAGLGCPDWPRCFGTWLPPASAAALPAPFDPAQFNATLMWTEYLNRLLGVSVGFAILATTVVAWRRHRRQPRIVWPIVTALLLTGFQGWLGGRVVANALAPWIVTVHMLVALVIVQLLLWATVESLVHDRPAALPSPALRAFGWWTWAATATLLVQVALGTLVRGKVDEALDAGVVRAEALATVGALDGAHRELAVLVALAVVALCTWAWLRHGRHAALTGTASAALALVVAQLGAGAALAGRALPPGAQVSHLTLASLLLGALTTVALVAWRWPAAAVPPSSTAARTA